MWPHKTHINGVPIPQVTNTIHHLHLHHNLTCSSNQFIEWRWIFSGGYKKIHGPTYIQNLKESKFDTMHNTKKFDSQNAGCENPYHGAFKYLPQTIRNRKPEPGVETCVLYKLTEKLNCCSNWCCINVTCKTSIYMYIYISGVVLRLVFFSLLFQSSRKTQRMKQLNV